jgi:hypothetical protein
MKELLSRFERAGAVVSAFAMLGDLFVEESLLAYLGAALATGPQFWT